MVENYLRKPVQKETNRVADTNPRTGKHIIRFRNSTNYIHANQKCGVSQSPMHASPKSTKLEIWGRRHRFLPATTTTPRRRQNLHLLFMDENL
jgi:hypothetical protein